LHSPKRRRAPWEGTPADSAFASTTHSIGNSSPLVNHYTPRYATPRHSSLGAVATFGLVIGGVLYFVAHVLAANFGWRTAAMVLLAGWLVTIVAAALASSGGRR
jgi:uncharacterized PurR-regulated membrane protein YhhQ (DUF165 family)